ncbi:MAG: class I SAM-dependent methyltransferase [Desulfovibrionaceae bacterium]|nr:class I SAM-dependent methyltransferase [Desulfovibrionaceae bacterium]MBF0514698.1 class I SAM-dependent methyltransferase [Desulfovibrionaceae bacterium]
MKNDLNTENDSSLSILDQRPDFAFHNIKFCPFCGDSKKKESNSFKKLGHTFCWEECVNCGLIYQNPRLTKESLSLLYQSANFWRGVAVDEKERILGYDNYLADEEIRICNERAKVRYLSRLLPQHGRILDIACGTGTFLKVAREQGFATAGIELSEAMSTYGREVDHLDIVQGDFENVQPKHGSYDAVTLWNADNIFLEPKESWRRIHDLLAPDGVFVMNFLENKLLNKFFVGAFSAWRDCHSLYIPCRKSIRELSRISGFQSCSIRIQWGYFRLDRAINVLSRLGGRGAGLKAGEMHNLFFGMVNRVLHVPMPGFFLAVMRKS